VRRPLWLSILVIVVAIEIAIGFGVRARWEGFSVPSASMEPALLPGDYILVDKAFRSPDRGTIIVFHDPHDEEQLLVKRVIGLGGEEIHVADSRVFVDCRPGTAGCQPLAEPYADFSAAPIGEERSGDWRVPADGYFVMADNRNVGEDSRHWGALTWDRIVGRPIRIYWSRDPDSHAIRWSRLGRTLH
jgi:signal peptidase I